MRRNKGFSMIELIVILAVLGISATLIGGSISQIFSLDQKQCATELNAVLSRCKIGSMSRAGDVYLVVSAEADGVYSTYYENDAVAERQKIGKHSLSLTYTDETGASHTVSETEPLYLAFQRTTGAFLTVGQAHKLADSAADASLQNYYCTVIRVGGYRVELVPMTGRHDVVR